MISYGRQSINQDDIDAVINVLKSDFLTQGPKTLTFEKKVASYCKAEFALSANSATSALHIACLALGLQQGDIIWTSPISFVASSNCALYCGAKVDFVDINPKTYNLSVEALEEKLIEAKKQGLLPKIVIPVHLTGQPCEMESIHKLSQQYGFKIIEDASHAIGGRYQNELIGSCKYSDVTVFSFHPVKIITTAEGGMVLTNNPDLVEKMALLRSHGITRDPKLMTKEPDGSWYYQQIELGFNYRMTELQAALGESQMNRIDEFVSKRHKIAEIYNTEFSSLPIITPIQIADSYSAYHLYVIRLKLDQIKQTHRTVFEKLKEKDIGVNVHYIPIHLQPYYQELGFKIGDFPNAERYYQEAITLPLHPNLSYSDVAYVVDTLKQVLKEK